LAIPDYQSVMHPFVRCLIDGQDHSIRDLTTQLADEFHLTPEERRQLLPMGSRMFDNRVAWARTYLKEGGLIEAPRRGVVRITERGRAAIGADVQINNQYLQQFTEFQHFRARTSPRRSDDTGGSSNAVEMHDTSTQTPQEQLELAHASISADLARDVLVAVKGCSPEFFEKLVVDLLVRMGYGGSRAEAGEALGKSGDEGIDGIIKEDRLGLDAIYLQAKRWEASVGRPEVQKFAGALQGARASKGIMITTSSFTTGAIEYVRQIETRIILIDGLRLADLMIEHDVGVAPVSRFDLKRLDHDYFVEE
jgi:restriction system protein